MEKINLKDYEKNESWIETLQIGIRLYNVIHSKMQSENDSLKIVEMYIDLLNTCCEIADNYKDCIKEAYDVIQEVIFYVPLTYDEQKLNKEQQTKLEEMYNKLRDDVEDLRTRTKSYSDIINVIQQKGENDDISSEEEQICLQGMNNLSMLNNEVLLHCAEIYEYVQNIKTSINKYQMQLYSEEEISDDGQPGFLS